MATKVSLYLTSQDKSNFRYKKAFTKPYKGQRTGDKPAHFQVMRDYLLGSWGAYDVVGAEADDEVCAVSFEYYMEAKEDNVIMAHVDKDLDQTPGWHYNYHPKKRGYYYVGEQEACKLFWTQMLTGDTVDNIQGIKGVGPAKADKLLADCNGWSDYHERVSSLYEDAFGDNHKEVFQEHWDLLRMDTDRNHYEPPKV